MLFDSLVIAVALGALAALGWLNRKHRQRRRAMTSDERQREDEEARRDLQLW